MLFTLGEPPASISELLNEYAKMIITERPEQLDDAIFALRITDPFTRAVIERSEKLLFHYLGSHQLSDDALRVDVFRPFLDAVAELDRNCVRGFTCMRDFVQRAATSKEAHEALGLHTRDWDSVRPHEKLRRVGERLRVLCDDFSAELFDYQKEVQAEEVIYGALGATIAHWRRADVARYGNRARASLAVLTGYDSIPTGQLSATTRRDLYGVLLAAYDAFGPSLAKVVPVDLGNMQQALRIVSLATALRNLSGEVPHFSQPIATQEQYDEAERVIQERATRQFKVLLGLKGSGPTDEVIRLWEMWGGDLTPLTILASRYRVGQRSFPLKVLSEVAQHCLNGSFYSWRYRTTDGQLSMLDSSQLCEWRKNRFQLSKHTGGEVTQLQADLMLVREAARVFESKLLQDLPHEIAQQITMAPLEEAAPLASLAPLEIERLLNLSERDFSRLPIQDAMKLVRAAIDSQDAQNIRKAVILVYAGKDRLCKKLPEDVKKALLADFKALHSLVDSITARAGTEYYVASVITDHPKLLLMTNDLIRKPSCSEIRFGAKAWTLPGNVIDGNVQLALSYVVRASVLDEVLQEGCSVSFDPATQSLIIEGCERPFGLGYAAARQLLRLGRSAKSGEPACSVEPPHAQDHLIQKAILDQQRRLIGQHLTSCQVSRTVGVEKIFPASRYKQ